MREAAIDSQRALSRDRRSRVRKPRFLQACGALFVGLFRAHPARTCAAAVFALMLSGIVLNAVMFQKGRHPAPLFGSKSRGELVPAPAVPMPVPKPSPESAEPNQKVAAEPSTDVVASVPAPRPPSLTKSAKPHKEDAIGQLLRDEGKAQPPGASSKATGSSVLAAQRALQKLGYDVALDGHMGASTRQALDKFEREHHIATGGEVTPKLLRELAGAAEPPHG